MFNLVKISSKTDLAYYAVSVERYDNAVCLFLFNADSDEQILSLFVDEYENVDLQNMPLEASNLINKILSSGLINSKDLIMDRESLSCLYKNIFDKDQRNIKIISSEIGLVYVEIYSNLRTSECLFSLKGFVKKSAAESDTKHLLLDCSGSKNVSKKSATAIIGSFKQEKIITEIAGFEELDISKISRVPHFEVDSYFYEIKHPSYAKTPTKTGDPLTPSYSPYTPSYVLRYPNSHIIYMKEFESPFKITPCKNLRDDVQYDALTKENLKLIPCLFPQNGVDSAVNASVGNDEQDLSGDTESDDSSECSSEKSSIFFGKSVESTQVSDSSANALKALLRLSSGKFANASTQTQIIGTKRIAEEYVEIDPKRSYSDDNKSIDFAGLGCEGDE